MNTPMTVTTYTPLGPEIITTVTYLATNEDKEISYYRAECPNGETRTFAITETHITDPEDLRLFHAYEEAVVSAYATKTKHYETIGGRFTVYWLPDEIKDSFRGCRVMAYQRHSDRYGHASPVQRADYGDDARKIRWAYNQFQQIESLHA